MLFHSPIFLFFFLPLVLSGYLLLERGAPAGLSIGFLALASLFFYSWWNPYYLPLLLGSIVFNFTIGHLVNVKSRFGFRYGALVFGVTVNLLLLGAFKYADFAIRTINWGGGTNIPELDIVLPLAISFFTFQQIAFLVDSYQGKAPEDNFPAYCLFITFFPHLIAGPIVHHREMMPQFARLIAGDRRRSDEVWRDLAVGFSMFTIGLVKKVFFAGQFATWSDNAFRAADAGAHLSFGEAWLGTACFSLQIYLDFSAYTDMALGLSRLFGVKLPLNFNSPYKAASIIEFWHRWHMTLSRFLRDYLYYPLGGNKLGTFRQYVNIFIVMLLGGLWHGASWTFVAWGGLHGAFLVVNHGYRSLVARGMPAVKPWIGVLLTVFCVMVAWVFFRADSFAGAFDMTKGLFGFYGIALPPHWEPTFGPTVRALADAGLSVHFAPMTAYSGGTQIGWVIAGFLAMWLLPNSQEIMRDYDPAFEPVAKPRGMAALLTWRPSAALGVCFAVASLAAVFIVLQGKAGEFIYFQF